MKDPNDGYSGWGYIVDKEYAKSPTHYIRAFMIIQSDLQNIFEYIEPSSESLLTYSYRIHELLMRSCIEIEANFKAILSENIYSPSIDKFGNPILNMGVYKKVNKTHHLSSYEVSLPIWNGQQWPIKPFESWTHGVTPPWYQAYNASKHDRHHEFKNANMENLINAVAGLLVVISSQFHNQTFSPGETVLSIEADEYHEMKPAIGSLFRIKFPEDWSDHEKYDFDWSIIKKSSDRFEKIDYNQI